MVVWLPAVSYTHLDLRVAYVPRTKVVLVAKTEAVKDKTGARTVSYTHLMLMDEALANLDKTKEI